MNNRMDNESNVAGIAYNNLEEYCNGLVFEQNLPEHLTNPFIDAAGVLIDNDYITDDYCANQIDSLFRELESKVGEYQTEAAEYNSDIASNR